MVVNDVVLSDRLHQTAKLPHRRLRPTAILQLLQANAKNLFLAAHLSSDIIQTSFQRLTKTEIILVVGQNLKRFDRPERPVGQRDFDQIGRASCRERVCQYLYISVVAVPLKNKITKVNHKR